MDKIDRDHEKNVESLPAVYTEKHPTRVKGTPGKKQTPVEKLIELSERYKGKYPPRHKFDLHVGRGIVLDTAEIESGEKDIYVDFETRRQHIGCIGTTGSGKTRLMTYMAVQDIFAGNSVLVVDPKYDETLLATIIEAATLSGRLDEFLYFNPILPDISNKVNLLYSYYIPDELVDHVVAGVRAREEYFENVAYEVTLSIIMGLYALAKARGEKLNINFYEVKRWCSYNSLAELKNSLSYLTNSSDSEVRKLASDVVLFLDQILSSPADFFAKVSSSLRTVLTSLSASSIGDMIGKASYNEFLNRLETGRKVIAYCNTGVLLIRKASHVFARILISMIQSLIGRMLSAGKTINPPLVIYLDEGHNMLYRGIDELFAKGRAANVILNFFTQSISSIKAIAGDEYGRVIMDNISTWIYFRVNCEETAAFIERNLPQAKTYKKRFTPGKEGSLVILGEDESPLYNADKILRLPNRRFLLKLKDKFYVCDTPEVKDPKLKIKIPLEIRTLLH